MILLILLSIFVENQKLNKIDQNILPPTFRKGNLTISTFFKFFSIIDSYPSKTLSYIGTQIGIIVLMPKDNFKDFFKEKSYYIRIFEEDYMDYFAGSTTEEFDLFFKFLQITKEEFCSLLKSVFLKKYPN